MKNHFSEAEWSARVDLAACYRIVSLYGMTDLINNHISAKVPGTDNEFLINPFGLMYEEVTASSLFKVNLKGEVLYRPDVPYDFNRAGFVIHSAVHEARPDVASVLHTHTRAGITVATMKDGLMPISQGALRFYNRVGYHEFEGPAVDDDEKGRLVANLGSHDTLILRNHGLLTCGRSIAEAFLLMQRLETACKIQVDLLASGAELVWPTQAAQEKTARILAPAKERQGEGLGVWDGSREWSALLRQVERKLPGFDA